MALETKPTSKQTGQLRIRTNIVPLRFYVPDDDDSVPYAFALGRNTISTAGGCGEALLSGYFSTLCAVLPDLTDIARKVMNNLGYHLEEILIPSRAAAMKIEITPSRDLRLEVLKFAQICFLPFQSTFDNDAVAGFWNDAATRSGVNLTSCKTLCSAGDMRTISSNLSLSGAIAEVRSSIASSMKALAATSTPFGIVLTEAAKLNQQRIYSGRRLYGHASLRCIFM